MTSCCGGLVIFSVFTFVERCSQEIPDEGALLCVVHKNIRDVPLPNFLFNGSMIFLAEDGSTLLDVNTWTGFPAAAEEHAPWVNSKEDLFAA